MVGPDGRVVAVLDWEICTLGDPLADVGLLQVYWTDETDSEATLLAAPTLAAGFPTRAELTARYAATSDRDLSQLDFYVAFGYWKLACILEGVYSRCAGGPWATRPGSTPSSRRSPDWPSEPPPSPARLTMPLYELLDEPDLESPVAVLALDGWIDAGLGAQNARQALLQALETTTVATFDADALLDFRSRRPMMHLADGVLTGLTWPSIELQASTDFDGNDLLLLVGAEPDHQWQTFSSEVTDLFIRFGLRSSSWAWAYPSAVPHTRSARLASAASEESLARFCAVRTTVDVPTGVQGGGAPGRPSRDPGDRVVGTGSALRRRCRRRRPRRRSSTAWRRWPTSRCPVTSSTGRPRPSAAKLDELVAANPEHVQMVQQLEAQWDGEEAAADDSFGTHPLPSGDELAAELERYLREQGTEPEIELGP